MLFNSVDFIIFFPIVILVYYAIPYKIKNIWLLICSYYFYMCWNTKYIILLFFSTIVSYVCGLMIEWIEAKEITKKSKIIYKKMFIAICLLLNLSTLGFFKYSDYLLPIGISFYTFQALGYTIDVYRNEICAEKNFIKYSLFVSFFPQVTSGPIERYKNLSVQYNEKHSLQFKNVREGLFLIFWGYFLKLVLADRIAIVVNTVYADVETYGGCYIIVATFLFAFQILCDFNGYTIIARGAAQILGFRLMENFNAPYFADSVADFWRRWHISLSSWFRDYLYIPLGGNRKGKIHKYVNIMIVFIVSGIWHGASLAFVIWGGLNGLYQVLGEILKPVRDYFVIKLGICRETLSHRILKVATTFVMVDFAWLFFCAGTLEKSKNVLTELFVFNPEVLIDGSLYSLGLGEHEFQFMLCMLLVLMFADYLKYKKINVMEVINQQGIWLRAVLFTVLFWTVMLFGIFGPEYEASQFIYFQF